MQILGAWEATPLEQRGQSHQLFAVSFFPRIVRMFAQSLEIVLVDGRFETILFGQLPKPFENVPFFSSDAGYLNDASEIGGDLLCVQNAENRIFDIRIPHWNLQIVPTRASL